MGAWLDCMKEDHSLILGFTFMIFPATFGLSWLYWSRKITGDYIQMARYIESAHETQDDRDVQIRTAEIDFTAILLFMRDKKIKKSLDFSFKPNIEQEKDIIRFIPQLGCFDVAYSDSPN